MIIGIGYRVYSLILWKPPCSPKMAIILKEKEIDKVTFIVYDDDGNELGEFTSKGAAITFAEWLRKK
jgi:hypothetical protein